MINLRIVKDTGLMNQELQRLVDRIFLGMDSRVCLHGQTWSPQMDIYETPDAYLIVAEMSGLKPEEIDLVVDRGRLKISGCRQQPALGPNLRIHQMEMDYGHFERAFRLPSAIIPEGAKASCDLGILRIVLPKEKPTETTIGILTG